MPLSDATLLHRFTGSNRRYVLVLSDGEWVWFRARDAREAWRVAEEFTDRLADRTLRTVFLFDGSAA